MTERKATDILLDIEKTLNLVLGYQKTNDLNQKLLLNRLNKIVTGLENKSAAPVKRQPSVEAFVTVPTPPSKTLVAKPMQVTNAEDFDEEGKPQIEVELQPKTGRRDIRMPTQQGKKVAVQQRIHYPDGKNVILASIEITDAAKNVIKKTRTNSAGKWNATLDPGRYFIHVTKSATTEKPVVEHRYEVEIPISDSPLELEPKV